MLKKILQVNDFRVFKGWRGEPAATDFGTVNLIYGVNGSGKSTLTSLLAAAPRDDGWKSGLRVTVLNVDGTTSTVSAPDHDIWQAIRVFNKDYVANNLRFDVAGDSTTEPLLILGKEEIDKKAKTDQIQVRLAKIADLLPKLKSEKLSATRIRERLATDTASLISSELIRAGARYAPRSYDARRVKALLAAVNATGADYDATADLELARSDALSNLGEPSRTHFDTTALEAEVKTLLTRTATSESLTTLRENPTLAAWVQTGLELHNAGDSCGFCGGGVSGDRLAQLSRHFDASLRALQESVRAMSERLVTSSAAVDSILELLPDPEDVDPGLMSSWDERLASAEITQGALKERLDALRELVEQKADSLFDVISMPAALPGQSVLDLASLVEVIQQHNDLVANVASRRTEAARRVEEQRVEAIRPEYERLGEEIERAAESIDELDAEKLAAEQELRRLAQVALDAVPLADSLNDDLARLLGRDDLKFHLHEGGRYSIRRADEPALYLSEGEKTAISLLYFLRSLDAHDCDRTKTIVVIDDPVSSLDSNVVAGVSAHLWSRLVGQSKSKQLFLLTHSFELFRSWGLLLDRVPEAIKRREKIEGTLQELRVRMVVNQDGSVSRRPFMVPWPTAERERAKIRSEYHYLFWRAASTLEDCQADPTPDKELDAAAILPNVCRRLLEGFLSFKYPQRIGDFRGLVEAAIGDMDDSITRTRLVTFLHQYSHNEEGDISKPVSRPESINILATVFELIRYVDGDHYEKMCAALRVEPHLLTL